MTYRFKISRRLAGNHRWRAIACTALALFAGCLPGNDSDPVLSQGGGVLTLTATGLAPQGKLQAILIGPDGFRQEITDGGSLTGLPFGNYQIHFLPTMVDGDRWVPSSDTEKILIASPSQAVSLTIRYEFSSGTLDLRPEGVPDGTELVVHLTGPGGYSRDVAGPSAVRGLAPGTYTVTPAQGTFGTAVYRPTTPATQIEVVSSTTPVPVVIPYWRAIGALDVQVSGLPLGAVAQYTVAGPGSFQVSRTGSTQLTSLNPGTYTITASPVAFEGNTWAPITAQAPVVVDTGTVTIAIEHEITTGTLALDVEGLPAELSTPVITISGPAGFVQDLATSHQWVGIVPGTYNARASVVSYGARRFVPNQPDQNIPVAPSTNPSRGSVNYSELMGSLTITVGGLPSGAAGRVVVTGNAFADTVVATTTLPGLSAGSYALVAESVTIGGVAYHPTPSSQSATIAAGESATKTVTYTQASPTTGSLNVSVTGLSGSMGAISVSGPSGFTRSFGATTTLADLTPGTYTISASNVATGSGTSQPTPATQTATVTAGETTTKSVAYAVPAPTTGSLAVMLSGLPGGEAGAIAVTGPDGFSRTFTATTTLSGLVPGTYTVAAANITSGGATYQPTPATQSAAVAAGETTTKSVAYAVPAPTTGSLVVMLSGLPGGAAGAIAVTGPDGFSRTFTATTTLSGLVPGTYTVAAANITSGGATYQPTPATQSAAVAAGTTVTRAVAYAVSTGALSVTISGLPGGTAGSVRLTGPGGFTQSVTATTTLNGLSPGTYTVVASNVSAGGTSYTPNPISQTASVTAGTTVNRTVTYAANNGPATITVDTTTVFQTMTGWEATAQAGQSASGFSGWQNSLMDQAVTDLGLNAIRLEIKSGAEAPVDYYHQLQIGQITNTEYRATRYRPVNDNSNSNSINSSGYQFSELDESVDRVVLPLRQRIQARGEHLTINLNYVSFGGATFHTANAAEYAELMLATFQHLQSRYGWVPDAIEVILEPDNGTGWTGTQIGNAIVATGARLAAAGFHPEFIAPSTMSMAQAVPYMNQIVAVPGVLNYLTTIAYHRYAGVSDANLTAIRATAARYNLRTAQLEHIGSGVEDLYKDLTLANVSAWQQYTLAYPTSDNGAQYFTITGGQAVMGSRTKQLRQYFRYVRAGARRVAATSASGSVRPVAFMNPGGGMAVVVHVDSPGTFTVAGLRLGSYAVEMTNSAGALISMPSVTASGGNSVSISPSQTGVLTLYRVP